MFFCGNRNSRSKEEGQDHTVAGLQRVREAPQEKINLCIELLNSRVNHPDYQCDPTTWDVEVCKLVDSPRVKLLYDIYHMQIMEGDLIRTIAATNYEGYVGHEFRPKGDPLASMQAAFDVCSKK